MKDGETFTVGATVPLLTHIKSVGAFAQAKPGDVPIIVMELTLQAAGAPGATPTTETLRLALPASNLDRLAAMFAHLADQVNTTQTPASPTKH